ncbi:MAG: hypothetical protein ACK4V8_00025 [Moraxella osloensis]
MNAQERALAKAKEKVEEILWESPEGVSISALTGTLRISKPLAISALAALGAVEQNGVWMLPDDEVAQVEVAPGAKADMAAIEPLQNLHELPVSIVDASDVNARKEFYERAATRLGFEIKRIDQSVFDGLPSEIMWAAVDSHGTCLGFRKPPIISAGCYKQNVRVGDVENPIFIGWPFDNTNWMDSIIQREPVTSVDTVNPVSEQKQNDVTRPMPCIDQPVKAPSDYSPVFNNILDRVLQTIKTYGGATADRLRELTGMHPDDIEDAVQFMVDHKQLVGRPLYFTTVYEVVA